MRSPQKLVLAAVLAMPVVALAPIVLADGPAPAPRPAPGARPSDAGATFDPQNRTAMSQAMAAVVQGIAKYKEKDVPAAVALFERAMVLNPKMALAPYLLAEAHASSGKLAEADAALQKAEPLTDARDPAMRGRVLFLKADLLERQKKWPEAKAAWQAYGEHAAKYADAGLFPKSAEERIKALDKAMAQDKAYDIVRQRIAEEQDGGADAAKPPAKK